MWVCAPAGMPVRLSLVESLFLSLLTSVFLVCKSVYLTGSPIFWCMVAVGVGMLLMSNTVTCLLEWKQTGETEGQVTPNGLGSTWETHGLFSFTHYASDEVKGERWLSAL